MDLINAIFSVPNLRGDIALWSKGPSGGTRFITIDEIESFHNERDWYFHLATHDRTMVKPGGRGSKKSAQQFTTLWCDLDISDKDPKYATQAEIGLLFADLVKDGMKPSAVVDSGGGLHAYWFLNKPEESSKYPSACKAWIKYLADRLDALCNRKVALDQGTVGAMSAVLRVPNTINSKHGKLVRQLHCDPSQRYELDSLLSFTTYNEHTERGTGKTAVTNKLLQAMGSVKSSNPSYTENIIYSCGQVRNFFKTGGDVSEPTWYNMAGLLPFTEDGLNYFVNLSVSETDAHAKVEQWKKASDGPATCKNIDSVNPGICQHCPHFNKITTPLQLGHSKPTKFESPVEVVQAPKGAFNIEQEHYIQNYIPPQPFHFDQKGGMFASVEDSTGANRVKLICHNKVIPYKRIWSEDEGQEIVYFNVDTPNDGWREVDLTLASIQGSCPALSKLMGSGALIVNTHSSLMAGYLTGCVKYMQEQKEVNQSYSRIGWRGASPEETTRETDDRFVLGDITFYKDGRVKQESLIPELKKSLKDIGMKGNVDEWKQAVSILAKPGFEKHLICFMGSFAVPLFRASDYHGLLVNLLSRESGTFKSFTLKMISSVYGQPVCDHILNRDSEKSVYAKIANRCDLPITYDEITNIERDDLSDLAYAITQGRRADRLNQDSTLKVNDSIWRTIMFSSSNSSLDDMLSGTNLAERMRVLELPIGNNDSVPTMSDAEARATISTLSNNYGQAGVLWIKYIMDNKDKLFQECNHMISELTTITKSRNDKRFWISFLAFVLVAAKHTRLMGLHSFDINAMANTCKGILDASSSKVDSDHIPLPMYVHQYLTQHLDNTLTITYNSLSARTGTTKREPRAQVTVKIENRSGGPGERLRTAFISRKAMQQYLTEQRVTFKDFMQELRDINVLIDENLVKRIQIPDADESYRLSAFSVDLNKLDEIYMTEAEAIDKQSTII